MYDTHSNGNLLNADEYDMEMLIKNIIDPKLIN